MEETKDQQDLKKVENFFKQQIHALKEKRNSLLNMFRTKLEKEKIQEINKSILDK